MISYDTCCCVFWQTQRTITSASNSLVSQTAHWCQFLTQIKNIMYKHQNEKKKPHHYKQTKKSWNYKDAHTETELVFWYPKHCESWSRYSALTSWLTWLTYQESNRTWSIHSAKTIRLESKIAIFTTWSISFLFPSMLSSLINWGGATCTTSFLWAMEWTKIGHVPPLGFSVLYMQ